MRLLSRALTALTGVAVLTSLAGVAGVPGLALAPAQAACVSSTRVISGTIAGIDGRYTNTFIGFDLKDHAGRTVGLDGCAHAGGYGARILVNQDAPATGTTNPTGHTKSWSLRVPTNVTQAFIEAYPKAPSGTTTTSRYSLATRTQVAIPYGHPINIRLALLCSLGGQTGRITGHTTATRVSAFSRGPDTNAPGADAKHPILGFGIATISGGVYDLPVLAAGQDYTMVYTINGVQKLFAPVHVSRCGTTVKNLS